MKAAQWLRLLWLAALSSSAQVQEAWVNHYNGGYTNLSHSPIGLALDSSGNLLVAGSSQHGPTNSDYVVLKYAPDGTQVWAARWAPPTGSGTVNSFALDGHGDTSLTGTAGTVKISAAGALAWVAPYAGTSHAADANGNVYLTGFAGGFAVAKLDAATGSNVWTTGWSTQTGYPARSDVVAVDQGGNLYAAGAAQDYDVQYPVALYDPYLVRFDASGQATWACLCLGQPKNEFGLPGVQWLAFDSAGDAYVTCTDVNSDNITKVAPTGTFVWGNRDFYYALETFAAAVDAAGNLYRVGGPYFWVVKQDGGTGAILWETSLGLGNPVDFFSPAGLAPDLAGNVYVCGLSGNDLATVKLDKSSGSVTWRELYNGATSGAVALAVAPDGSIYVTTSSANTSGGTDITTIKYVQEPTIQAQAGGAMFLQLPGLPGSSAGLAATANFINWTELGPVVANTNGLFQFTDTNATLYPYRFYRWH